MQSTIWQVDLLLSLALMLVLVRRAHATGTEPRAYHLLVPRTYGEVAEVRVAVKAKRLLVKLVKKRKHGMNMWDKSNLKPWPQLSEKVMAGGATAARASRSCPVARRRV